ncbi:hypothetical protein MY4824_007462 [Beauveria thailandica]
MSLFPRALHEGDSSSFSPLFRLLDEFDNYSRQGGSSFLGRDGSAGSVFWQPKFDIRESSDQYELHGEFSGVKKDDIYTSSSSAARSEDISDKPTFTEAGEGLAAQETTEASTKATGKAEKPKYWLRERKVGEFSRSFSFPSPVDQDGISAGFKDGILSVSVPKARKPQPRRIAIN